MMMWLNTGLIDDAVPSIFPADRGLTLGDGVFETIAARHGGILRLEAHLDRLKQGCAVLGIPFPTLDFLSALTAVLEVNHMLEAVLRVTVTRGVAPRGVLPPLDQTPTLLITAAPFPQIPASIRCVIVQGTRRNEYSPLCRIKALPYLDNILALQEAVAQGGDDAIILNTSGRVAEASRANIFIVRAGQILTPPVKDGALPGVTRAALMRAMPVNEWGLWPEDLYQAEEMFLTNSLGVQSVISINGLTLNRHMARSILPDIKVILEARS